MRFVVVPNGGRSRGGSSRPSPPSIVGRAYLLWWWLLRAEATATGARSAAALVVRGGGGADNPTTLRDDNVDVAPRGGGVVRDRRLFGRDSDANSPSNNSDANSLSDNSTTNNNNNSQAGLGGAVGVLTTTTTTTTTTAGGNNNTGGGQKDQYRPGDDDAYTWEDDDFNVRDAWSNTDQFTYQSERTDSPNHVYPPSQWLNVGCPDQDTCLGWPDSFVGRVSLQPTNNHCTWCPKDIDSREGYCRKHHGSPINLNRDVAVVGDPNYNACIDVHYMHYEDASCTFEMLDDANAFTIERHALKIRQPVDQLGSGSYRNGCVVPGVGSRWGKIDFSRGFSQWWLLSHTDIHVPSEHTQQGKRYDAEIQLHHLYSINTDGTKYQTNQMSAVSIFLEAFDGADDYPVLNRLICQYRKVEENSRKQCGLASVRTTYPGCTVYTRGQSETAVNTSTTLNDTDANSTERMVRRRTRQSKAAHDLMVEAYVENSARDGQGGDAAAKAPFEPRLVLDDNEVKKTVSEWERFIQSVHAEEEALKDPNRTMVVDYTDVSWNNYFPMLGCKTEYYYRYSGTMTVPPCFGRLRLGYDNRRNTNNWRIMKDPIPVSKRQIDEMHRLIRSRIAPVDDPLKACRADTAASTPDPDNPSRISVARPLQSNREAHWLVFCECNDWTSKWPEDQAWCRLNKTARFFDQPYNYKTDGF